FTISKRISTTQYPGFGQLEHASRQLGRWDSSHTRSPVRAYEAITAVFGDVTAPLRDEIEAGRANVDRELLLKGEAAGALAAAHTAEEDSETFDRQAKEFYDLYTADGSPGASEQLQARTNLMLVKQQSYIMRLLARTTRLQSVDAALTYGSRMDG